ncbi:uncharacterized protein LOC130665537 [Microplitis mediator]|uniref:uncharacterized protein LOC130665537 n=1 Tax=Microplitis mediator TaxID=375433 RepID=UPI0025578248|nr:uncharacterized protein LOC130665537 [Microplitis mediator]
MGKKRSRSRSRERDRDDRKTSKRLKAMRDQIDNLTNCVKEFIQSQSHEIQPADVDDANKENSPEEFNKNSEGSKTPEKQTDDFEVEGLVTTKNNAQEADDESSDWNKEFLELMGEELSPTGPTTKVDDTIEKQWTNWMAKGLTGEARKELLKKYSRVDNFRTEAPKVNLEVITHLSEVAKKRDQHFADTQNCVGTALVSLGSAISMLMENPEDGVDQVQLMKYIWDAGKIMADVFHQHSTARKSFITPNLDKDIKSTLEATVSDEWLYGQKLTDQVKDAKNIKKASTSLKAPEKPTAKKTTSQVNWRGPPGKARQVGYYPKRQFTNVKYKSRPFQTRPSQSSSRSTTQTSSRSTSKK